MAAAQARAGWQRSANRGFFSDEVKAHLFSGCSSSSTDDTDPATPVCLLRGMKSDPAPKTKWWLDLQPKSQYSKDYLCEPRNSLEADFEASRAGLVFKDLKCSKDYHPTKETRDCTHSTVDENSTTAKPERVSAACVINRDDSRMQELKAVPVSDPLKTAKSKDLDDFQYLDNKLMELDFADSPNLNQSKNVSSDFESNWLKIEKNEPWWRTADKDELAALVTQKSLDHIENCDLPPPQAKLLRNGPSLSWEYYGCDSLLSSSTEQKTRCSSSIASNYARGRTIMVSSERTKWSSQGYSSNSYIPDGSFSCDKNQDELDVSQDDLSRAQLVEALCYSQTRAREAEKAAEQAYSGKERVVKLFFRQAAELFAYRQWLELLQLENFCLQLKNKNHLLSNVFPVGLPSVSYKARSMRRRRQRAGKRKRLASQHGLCKCALAFALGLGLAGAGLLFGWSMGLLFQSF